MRTFALIAASLAAGLTAAAPVAPAFAADLTPSAILASPATYEAKDVSVAGTVAKYQTTKTMMGTVAAFQLCDEKCIVVIDETATAHKDGDKVTVAGTFQSSFKGPKRSFKNVVVVK
jgi:hypothetical protein